MENGKLMELISTESKLLAQFKLIAPGTYKHCQNVSAICESVAKELELDAELLKVCGMLHDIGKTANPLYFTENQDEKNPHDDLEPMVSYQIITRHVADGVMILVQDGSVPREIIQIISEHHGSSVLTSIFNKANKGKASLDDSHYRYKSSKPQSIASAVLMIVDSVEATARAMHNSGNLEDSSSRKQLISDTIERLSDDEQLDELKLGDLRKIKRILQSELDSIYHKRLSYDEDDSKTETIGKKKK